MSLDAPQPSESIPLWESGQILPPTLNYLLFLPPAPHTLATHPPPNLSCLLYTAHQEAEHIEAIFLLSRFCHVDDKGSSLVVETPS